jgi:hypothetical protein
MDMMKKQRVTMIDTMTNLIFRMMDTIKKRGARMGDT